jgi:hypothetical protein
VLCHYSAVLALLLYCLALTLACCTLQRRACTAVCLCADVQSSRLPVSRVPSRLDACVLLSAVAQRAQLAVSSSCCCAAAQGRDTLCCMCLDCCAVQCALTAQPAALQCAV